jgi:alpha-ketoglutarate-dependent taurine dioxygenase
MNVRSQAVHELALAGEPVGTWFNESSKLPLFIRPKGGAFPDSAAYLKWIQRVRPILDQLIVKHGAVVLRGFPLVSAEDFDSFVQLFPIFAREYIAGGAPRGKVTENVFESTRAAPEFYLHLHQEMAYLPDYPARLAFFCRKPAEEGGETIIADMGEFTRRLPPHVRERLETHGIRAVRNYGPAGSGLKVVLDTRDGIAWDDAFGSADRAQVELACAARNLQPIWRDDGGLTVVAQQRAFATHPVTGEQFYRNIIHTSYLDTTTGKMTHKMEGPFATGYTYGDGSPMPLEDAQSLFDVLCELTLMWPWQAGDTMIVDNLQIAHGRNRYRGTRETLVALLK